MEPPYGTVGTLAIAPHPAGAAEGDEFASSPRAVIDARLIEEYPEADVQVDFANMQLHIAQIISSCTQEEVMFTQRPELYASLLMYDTLQVGEVAVMTGVLSFATSRGYLDTFEAVSSHYALLGGCTTKTSKSAVLAIDAHVNRGYQFMPDMCRRDLNKALVGFVASAIECQGPSCLSIATGPWGCGIFAGDPILKFVQQIMAAAMAQEFGGVDTRLYYHAKGEQAALLQKVAKMCLDRHVSVGWLYQCIIKFGEADGSSYAAGRARTPFGEFLLKALSALPVAA